MPPDHGTLGATLHADPAGGGDGDSLIANCFPDLPREQVYERLAYYEDHRREIDAPVARQMSAGEQRPSCSTMMSRRS